MCQTTRAIRSGAGKNRVAAAFISHLTHQFLLELPVQSPGAVVGQGDGCLRPGPGERAEGGEDRFPVSRIGHDDAAGALMNHGLPGPGLALQPGFQQVRLADGHVFLPEPQTHPAPALVYDGRSHSKSPSHRKREPLVRLPSAVFRPPGPPPGPRLPWRPGPR